MAWRSLLLIPLDRRWTLGRICDLLGSAHLDLANALPAHSELLGQFIKSWRVIRNAPGFKDDALAVAENAAHDRIEPIALVAEVASLE